jgi:hypothetical protein
LALVHCLIVIQGASGLRVKQWGPLGELITYYGALTGAERGFGFFAPKVSTEARIRFLIDNGQEQQESLLFEEISSSEVNLRINNIASQVWQALDSDDVKMRRSLSASLAGWVFGRKPNAGRVTIIFEAYHIPTMQEARQGNQKSWKQVYSTTLERNKS